MSWNSRGARIRKLVCVICVIFSLSAAAQRPESPAGSDSAKFAALVSTARTLADSASRLIVDPRPIARHAREVSAKSLAQVPAVVVIARRRVLQAARIADTNALLPLGHCQGTQYPPVEGTRADCPRDKLTVVMISTTVPVPLRKERGPAGASTARLIIRYLSPYGFYDQMYDCTVERVDGAWRVTKVVDVYPPGAVF